MVIQIVPQTEIDRLLEKQWRARIELKKNPFAKAMNLKWRRYFRDSIQDTNK